MKAWLAKMAVKGIKVAIRAFGEGVVGAALEHVRKEKRDETKAATEPWSKAKEDL